MLKFKMFINGEFVDARSGKCVHGEPGHRRGIR